MVTITVVAVTLGFSALLTVFIISTTFAFTVAERREELARLSLAGATSGQIRRILLGEAVVLGIIGTVFGIPLGLPTMTAQTWMLERLGIIEPGFEVIWVPWFGAASLAIGVGLALAGVFVTARKGARVKPLEAFRGTESASSALGGTRLVIGITLGAGAVVLLFLAPRGGPAGGQAMAMLVSVLAVIATAVLAPAILPLASRILPEPSGSVTLTVARANLRDAASRSAATAAPLIVLVGLFVGQAVTQLSFSAASAIEMRSNITADLVVPGSVADAVRISDAVGVDVVSTEVSLPAEITTVTTSATGSGDDFGLTEIGRVLIVDPKDYMRVHHGASELTALVAGTVAAGPGALLIEKEDHIGIRVGDTDLGRLPVAAVIPQSLAGGASLILPSTAVPSALLAQGESVSFVTLAEGFDRETVSPALRQAGEVQPFSEWADSAEKSALSSTNAVMVAVMGLGALYAVLAVINAIIISASSRGQEYSVLRSVGMRRRQILLMALAEGFAIAVVGALIGLICAAGSAVATLGATAAHVEVPVLTIPWALIAATAVGGVAVSVASSVLVAARKTRPLPTRLAKRLP
ncbi:FtsX-like permease family protein [Paenarthrobacter aurescens]|uniref:FtsX-like permease family protein n=1 Tax=Paenarthrobacter aurescens TaxID=43663 RepID=UPI0035E57F6E